jgi:F0F1-type ATP synthase assembly protein I
MGNCLFIICLLDNKQSAFLIRFFSYAGDEILRFILVTLIVALLNKLLSQLDDDARLTLCILGVTAVRNFLK